MQGKAYRKNKDLTAEQISEKFQTQLNECFATLTKVAQFRYNYLVYRLLKKGLISKSDLAREAGITEKTIYRILDKVDEQLQEE